MLGALATLLVVCAVPGEDGPAPILGSGEHTYEWVRDWPQIPWGDTLGSTHGQVIVDSEGLVYVNTDTERAVCVFRPDGTFVRAFGEQLGSGVHGMDIAVEDGREVLYLAYLKNEVIRTTLEGEILSRTGTPAESGKYNVTNKKIRYHPTGIAVHEGGFIVADGYGLKWIHRYDNERKYLSSFGGPGEALGKLRGPHGIVIDRRPDEPVLIVADRDNSRLQLFTLEGEALGIRAKPLVRRPCSFSIQGRYLAIPDLQGRVTILDENYELVCHLGENSDPELQGKFDVPPEQWREGEFIAPHGATWDAYGNLYVVDWNQHGRVSKLRRVR